MAKTTRTLNPLHFEDLEPHRFEDLIRQLAYDFRPWKRLEPTGRLGSDDGIDIRGLESVVAEDIALAEGDEEEERPGMIERLWTIQCKREKSVHPADIKKIIKDAIPEGGQAPYGFILAAACDFSKKSRDTFILELRDRGVEEFYLWGKADLEDMLFLPKNDHLLFAYFGISLQIRRRAVRTEIRSRLATMKSIRKIFEDDKHSIYSPGAFIDATIAAPNSVHEIHSLVDDRKIVFCKVADYLPGSLLVLVAQYHAYADDERIKWDAILAENVIAANNQMIPWSLREPNGGKRSVNSWAEMEKVEKGNRAWLKVYKFIEYERIVAVDKEGHSWLEGPHLYVEPLPTDGLFGPGEHVSMGPDNQYASWHFYPLDEHRIEVFPADMRTFDPTAFHSPPEGEPNDSDDDRG